MTWHHKELNHGSRKRVIKPLFKASDLINWCHWINQNKRELEHTTTLICTNIPDQKWECTVLRLSTRLWESKSTLHTDTRSCSSWENLQTCSIWSPHGGCHGASVCARCDTTEHLLPRRQTATAKTWHNYQENDEMSSDDPLPVRSISCFVSLNSPHCGARRGKLVWLVAICMLQKMEIQGKRKRI